MTVNVTPVRETDLSKANVFVTINEEASSYVPTTIFWGTGKTPKMHLSLGWESKSSNANDEIIRTAMHEFGHVVGLSVFALL